ncbi:MAG: hypothetical protein U9N83_15425 [Thermodesulfobacteriota bacterium]|nr:hypothetical protein [Thermodesulfobacteriota bacterium]
MNGGCPPGSFTLLNFPPGTLFNRVKVRYYGFLHPGSSVPLEKIAALIELAFSFEIVTPKIVLEAPEPMICTDCSGSLVFRASLLPLKIVFAAPG